MNKKSIQHSEMEVSGKLKHIFIHLESQTNVIFFFF